VNDVITFGEDTKTSIPTTHRILAINSDGTYTTKGDANEEEDVEKVARRDVIGKVIFSLPYGGYVLDFARQPIGFVLLIAVPAGLVILEELLTIGKETRKWMKRRRRDDDESDGGGGMPVESLGTHLKKIYERRHRMDDIFVPRVVTSVSSPSRFARFMHSDAYGTSTALTVGLVFASTLFTGASGGTMSYFQDIEKSVGNIFGAGLRWEEEALAELAAKQAELALLAAAALSIEETPCEGEDCAPPPPPQSPEGAVLGVEDTQEEQSETPEPQPEAPPAEETPPADLPPAPEESPEPPADPVIPIEPPPAEEGLKSEATPERSQQVSE
jgi:hypothetical protein